MDELWHVLEEGTLNNKRLFSIDHMTTALLNNGVELCVKQCSVVHLLSLYHQLCL